VRFGGDRTETEHHLVLDVSRGVRAVFGLHYRDLFLARFAFEFLGKGVVGIDFIERSGKGDLDR
jgi:hypothetical protein